MPRRRNVLESCRATARPDLQAQPPTAGAAWEVVFALHLRGSIERQLRAERDGDVAKPTADRRKAPKRTGG